jgi:catechol 2,3-dioxygenase-like lactoylglutathione lyase family enzyme
MSRSQEVQTKEAVGLKLKGVDHLALVTDDMKATIRFYTQVLGMKLVHVRRVPYAEERGQPPYPNIRHYFFDMGNQNLLAFFEYPKDAPRGNRDSIGSMQHVAFHADRATFERFKEHFRANGIPFIGPVYLGDRFYSIYLFDPNNIRLEITTDLRQEDYDVITSVYQTEEEIRAELSTLYDTEEEIEAVLRGMPLKSKYE